MKFTEEKIEMNLSDLHSFFEQHAVPYSERSTGFLEIIGKQHHENINSALYAHFINSEYEEVKRLFLDTLLELVKLKSGKTLSFDQVFAETEVNTGKGRIDILITNLMGNDAILIENKIYHELKNDLSDYWEFVKKQESQKAGVLLTLHPLNIPDDVKGKFINITHSEWISLIKNRIQPGSLPEKYHLYIEDFITTIEQLSTSYKMNEAAKFYFEHTEQVLRAQSTIAEAHSYLNNQIQLIADKIGWQTYGNSNDWRNFWDEKNNLETFLTIITYDLIQGKKTITLVLELNGADMDRVDDLNRLLADHPQRRDKIHGKTHANYIHYLIKNYTLTIDELEDFANFVVGKIREDFAEMTLLVIRFLYPSIDTSEWEYNFLGKSSTSELI